MTPNMGIDHTSVYLFEQYPVPSLFKIHHIKDCTNECVMKTYWSGLLKRTNSCERFSTTQKTFKCQLISYNHFVGFWIWKSTYGSLFISMTFEWISFSILLIEYLIECFIEYMFVEWIEITPSFLINPWLCLFHHKISPTTFVRCFEIISTTLANLWIR